MDVPQAIAALQTDTEIFLKAQPFKIIGSGRNLEAFDGPANFKMEVNFYGGFIATYVTQLAAPLGTDEFQAWYIPMQQMQGFTANWLPGLVDTPLRIMLTSQFSGCLFGVGSDGSRTCVAHIQPDQNSHKNEGLSGPQIVAARQGDLRSNAMNANLSPFISQGKTHSDMQYATVVGIMNDKGKWKMLSQNINALPNTVDGINFI